MAFELRDGDVAWSRITTSGASPGRRSGTIQITLTHSPTGIAVSELVAERPGGRTRAEQRAQIDDTMDRLRTELTERVARHLRVPGR